MYIYDFELGRLAFMSSRNKIVIFRKRVEMRKSLFFLPLMHWFIGIIFTLQLISFTVHVWCPPSHGRFSSYIFLFVSFSLECVLRKYHVLMCAQVIFLPLHHLKFMITWKIHLSCLISSIAWHFFISLAWHFETHMRHSRKLSSYLQTCNCSLTSKEFFFISQENFNFIKWAENCSGENWQHKRRTRWYNKIYIAVHQQ